MGEHDVRTVDDEARSRGFMKALLKDVKAMEAMLEQGLFETGVRRIGAEQEMFLVDAAGRPVDRAVEVMRRLDGHPSFTHELALFNLEANLAPQEYDGGCLGRMEAELRELMAKVYDVAAQEDCDVVLTGILPTLRKANLSLDSMTPNPRYKELNASMRRMRGGGFQFRIKGIDELEATHDNVMLESANTSFQVHFQVDARGVPAALQPGPGDHRAGAGGGRELADAARTSAVAGDPRRPVPAVGRLALPGPPGAVACGRGSASAMPGCGSRCSRSSARTSPATG